MAKIKFKLETNNVGHNNYYVINVKMFIIYYQFNIGKIKVNGHIICTMRFY